jgi:2-keto-3-deoxy-L-rhamnonate aldolase RhmA
LNVSVRPNETLRKLRAGSRVLGAETSLFHPGVPLLYAQAGLDFIWIDLEHTLVNPERVAATIQRARLAGVTPIVRIPELRPGHVRSLLDNGAQGIILPFVEDAGAVEELVAWCRFHPRGRRGVGSPLLANDYANVSLAQHVGQSDAEILIAVQVESLTAVERIDEICAVDGLDVAVLGLADLSISCGVTGDVTHSAVVEAAERVLAAAARHEVAGGVAGLYARTYAEPPLSAWVRRGARFLQLFGDLGLLGEATFETVRAARAELDGLPG